MSYGDLTTKQKRFVDEYVGGANGNATQAAKRAGYSEKTARSVGHENLTKPDIQAAITERLDQLAMPAGEVLARLADISRGSLLDFMEILPGGSWRLDLEKAAREGKLHLLHEVSEGQYGPKIKLHDPLTALGLLGRRHGLFVDRQEHSGPGGAPIPVEMTGALEKVYGDAGGTDPD